MALRTILAAAVVAAAAAAIAFTVPRPGGGSAAAEARAAVVAADFFRTINARQYTRTCNLMSARFYRDNDVPSKARCVLGLRIGFMWAPAVRFKIVAVRVHHDRAVVDAVANGAPGKIVLVEEHGRFRVLSVHGA
jgi:hypothetical protein